MVYFPVWNFAQRYGVLVAKGRIHVLSNQSLSLLLCSSEVKLLYQRGILSDNLDIFAMLAFVKSLAQKLNGQLHCPRELPWLLQS